MSNRTTRISKIRASATATASSPPLVPAEPMSSTLETEVDSSSADPPALVALTEAPIVSDHNVPTVSIPVDPAPTVEANPSIRKSAGAHQSHKIVFLPAEPTRATIKIIECNLNSLYHTYHFSEVVPVENRENLVTKFQFLYPTDEAKQLECENWMNWDVKNFMSHINLAYPDVNHPSNKGFNQLISETTFEFSLRSTFYENKFKSSINDICSLFPDRTPKEDLDACVFLSTHLVNPGPINWNAHFLKTSFLINDKSGNITKVSQWLYCWLFTLRTIRALRIELMGYGYEVLETEHTQMLSSDGKVPSKKPDNRKEKASSASTPSTHPPNTPKVKNDCTGCGRIGGHMLKDCYFKESPYYNAAPNSYKESAAHTKLVAEYGPQDFIPGKKNMEILQSKKRSSSSSSSSSTSSNKKHKGKILSFVIPSHSANTDYLIVMISPLSDQQELHSQRRHEVPALLDTGSLAGDFIAERIIKKFNLAPFIVSTKKKTVCSGLDNKCYDISNSIPLRIFYFNEILNKQATFDTNAIVLKSTPVDLLIGRQSIKRFQLFDNIPSQLKSLKPFEVPTTEKIFSEYASDSCDCQPKEKSLFPLSSHKRFPHLAQNDNRVVTQTHGLLASLVLESEHILGTPIPDEDEIDHIKTDTFSHWLKEPSTVDVLSLINISGDENLQLKLRTLCTEFRDIFSNELPTKPASIPPFDLIVDNEKWRVPQNRTPPRSQSVPKQAELVKNLAILEKQGIIEKSHAAHYSQVLMVPKPDGSSRMCIDYRALNDCTPDASWPIPNITEMLRRIGAQKPKIFGVMDLTQGYHQAPLTLAARVFTAFITFSGVYQFTRLPFGPKRAPSYFQEMMATVVLVGLIYSICEMYIDDCNVFADNDDEFIQRLRLIFKRFRKHNMFLKASKCFFGFKEIDFVGKVLSENGLQMSRSKIQSVLDFPIPTISKQLKSFLGTVNYFRDFIRNQSTIVKPLYALIADYNKTKKIVWTSEAKLAFLEVKTQISKCTTMHFLSDTDPITLHTDASDYGVGGYLFQTVDGKEQPVAFVSKSLSSAQLRWSVIQKEAYGIFYSCTYLQSLLRDRQFTIRTDHRNLLFITQASNPMIVRWYMALSEFSFKIEFISGVENGIADSMSRLCRNNMVDLPREYSEDEVISSSIIEKFQLTSDQYHHIGKMHNSTVGHFGLERTLKRLKDQKLTWEFQRQHIRYFIDHCPCCQKMSMLKIPIHAHRFTTSTYTPMECLNIDYIGPFPDKGYILVIVDTFTKWIELYDTEDATALSAAQCLLKHFGRFGAPYQLRSDNGPHFIADLIREFLALVGIQHCLTLAYSKEENAIVERYNKEINRHIRALTFDSNVQKDYRKALPFVQRILNSNHSDRLQISSAQLLFGNILKLDRGIFLPQDERPQLKNKKPLSKYISDLIKLQDSLLKTSAKELLRTDLLHLTSKEIETHKEFKQNSYVLVHYRTGLPPTRLHTYWRGPMRVVSGLNSRYVLLDLITGKEKVYHVSDMKPFVFDPAIVDPVDIARRDYMEFFIEKILEHRGNLKRKTDLQFLVKWLGYEDQNNSWEPYSELRDSEQLHQYLLENNLPHLVPTKYR